MTVSMRFENVKRKFQSIFNDPSIKELFKHSSYLFYGNIFFVGSEFLQAVLYGRYLGVEQFGLLAIILTYVYMVRRILDIRVWEAATKYLSEFKVKGDRERVYATVKLVYLTDLSMGIAAFIMAIIGAPLLAKYVIHSIEPVELIKLFSIYILFMAVDNTSKAILRVFDKFKWLMLQEIFRSCTILSLVTIILLKGYGIKEVITVFLIGAGLGSAVLIGMALKTIVFYTRNMRRSSKISLLSDRIKEMFKFMIYTHLGSLGGAIVRFAPTMLLGYFRNPTEVGYYKLAERFVQVPALVIDPFYYAIYPKLSRMWSAGNIEVFKDYIKKVTSSMILIMLPIALIIFAFTPFVINLFIGKEFLPAVAAVRIMIWGIVIAGVLVWARPAILSINRPEVSLIASLIGAVVLLCWTIITIPFWGYIGSAFGFNISYVLGHIILIAGIKKTVFAVSKARL